MSTTRDHFPTEIEGLPEARPPELVELSDGDRFDLRIAPVAKRLGDTTVRMLAYNGSIPGPTLKVQEGSELIVDIENQGDMEATVHWHGLRLENRYDGTHETQTPIQVGEHYPARVTFPDPGVYWYHPHIREDYGQEMGLYANVVVEPADPDYWPPAHRELALTLDDILLEDGKVAPFSRAETTYAAMCRFGDVLLINGQTDLSLDAKPGDLGLEHHTHRRSHPLAAIRVAEQRAEPSLHEQFELLRTNADMAAERERLAPYLDAEPDKAVAFLAEMDMDAPAGDGPVVYACPMHPEVVSEAPGHCPECGMKLLAGEG